MIFEHRYDRGNSQPQIGIKTQPMKSQEEPNHLFDLALPDNWRTVHGKLWPCPSKSQIDDWNTSMFQDEQLQVSSKCSSTTIE